MSPSFRPLEMSPWVELLTYRGGGGLRSAGSAATGAEQPTPTPNAAAMGVGEEGSPRPRHGCFFAGLSPWIDLVGTPRDCGRRRGGLGSLRVVPYASSRSP